MCRFLPSIDRRMSLEDAGEVVSLALEYHTSTDKCVGLDLSGDPTVGTFSILFNQHLSLFLFLGSYINHC